jgi:hypothetical protein
MIFLPTTCEAAFADDDWCGVVVQDKADFENLQVRREFCLLRKVRKQREAQAK